MQISKKDFHRYLSEYTEDEIFYRNTYLQRTEHPETFREYLKNLDRKKYLVIMSSYYNRPNHPPIPGLIIRI